MIWNNPHAADRRAALWWITQARFYLRCGAGGTMYRLRDGVGRYKFKKNTHYGDIGDLGEMEDCFCPQCGLFAGKLRTMRAFCGLMKTRKKSQRLHLTFLIN